MNLLLNVTPATEGLGDILPLWSILPFVVMLLAIAVLPLATPGWYGPLRNKAIVAAAIGVPVLAYVIAVGGSTALERVISTGEEYISFIIYLATLFTISGGIYISGDAAGSPREQHASCWPSARSWPTSSGRRARRCCSSGRCSAPTTGARNRKHVFIFLIFIVCNTAGLLTPLGDPPLFLGFLRGIDFTWTLRLWPRVAHDAGHPPRRLLPGGQLLLPEGAARGAEARGGRSASQSASRASSTSPSWSA